MTMHRLKEVLIAALIAAGALGGPVTAVHANNLDSVLAVGKSKNNAARKSQVKIDRLAEETRDLLTEYKTVMKQVDGLKVYNERLQRQIENQLARIADIEENIDNSTVIARQMTPLVIRMIDGLEQFVELDVPFQREERMQRVEFLRDNLDRADVSVAEKFRAVLEAYNIELQYGRGIDTYRGTIDLGGASARSISCVSAVSPWSTRPPTALCPVPGIMPPGAGWNCPRATMTLPFARAFASRRSRPPLSC